LCPDATVEAGIGIAVVTVVAVFAGLNDGITTGGAALGGVFVGEPGLAVVEGLTFIDGAIAA
jgi:hypothetical protein